MSFNTPFVAMLAFAAGMAGCAPVMRGYPLCQFNGKVPSADFQHHIANTNSSLAFVAPRTQFTTHVTASQRWLLVSAKRRAHKKFLDVWPMFGCVGEYSSDTSHSKFRACLSTVRILADDSRRYSLTGPETDSLHPDPALILFCNGSTN